MTLTSETCIRLDHPVGFFSRVFLLVKHIIVGRLIRRRQKNKQREYNIIIVSKQPVTLFSHKCYISLLDTYYKDVFVGFFVCFTNDAFLSSDTQNWFAFSVSELLTKRRGGKKQLSEINCVEDFRLTNLVPFSFPQAPRAVAWMG